MSLTDKILSAFKKLTPQKAKKEVMKVEDSMNRLAEILFDKPESLTAAGYVIRDGGNDYSNHMNPERFMTILRGYAAAKLLDRPSMPKTTDELMAVNDFPLFLSYLNDEIRYQAYMRDQTELAKKEAAKTPKSLSYVK